ncbi:hypothetical protein SCHPADRAFT_945748 [Schizopora paradoxa]|uniref:Transmembrane protein n=1 Tax=Schizopora paradoxa TaxID=27342 RepID=A0A0H2R4S9_9AGAM|nr:hypothetical protein SCHPADRAFT_945748 [Schizopora paradoxa]
MSETPDYGFVKQQYDVQSPAGRHHHSGFAGSPSYIYRDRDDREDDDGFELDPHAELLRQLLVEVRGLREEKRKSEGGTKELAAAYAAIAVFLASIGISLLSYVQDTFSARSNEGSGPSSRPTDSAINCLLYLSVIFAVLAAVIFVVSQTMQEAGYHRTHRNDQQFGHNSGSDQEEREMDSKLQPPQRQRPCRRKLHKQERTVDTSSSSTAESGLGKLHHLHHNHHPQDQDQDQQRDLLVHRPSRTGTLSGMTIVNPSPLSSRRPTLEPIITGMSVASPHSSAVVPSSQQQQQNSTSETTDCAWDAASSHQSQRSARTTASRTSRSSRTMDLQARDGTREYDIASITLVSSLSTLFAGLLVYLWAERPHSVAIPCSVMILLSPGVVYVVLRDRVLAIVEVVRNVEV